jgi:two-component system CheB/CheR fusion protein
VKHRRVHSRKIPQESAQTHKQGKTARHLLLLPPVMKSNGNDRSPSSGRVDPISMTATTVGAPARVVGIGASAGGLDGLERFFAHLPLDSDAAFVVVQHLSPDFRSLLNEILSRRTSLPVQLVEDGMSVLANHIYVIPPKQEMIISGGHLLLSERGRDQDLSLPIDVFFKSLAQDCGKRSVAVVLSGGGSDGSRGARAVHEAGGMVIAQDEATAQFDAMPRAVRDAGIADWVLPPEEMPGVLIQDRRANGETGTRAIVSGNQGMTAVYRMLEDEFGLDFSHYKPSTVTRRIERRLQLSRVRDIDAYVEQLKSERHELDVLYRDLLIGVTRFFRNEEAFQLLEQRILPELFEREHDTPLRVWVAGCATGEEVYSLAILCHELAPRFGDREVKIFATDVHRGSLELATRGVFSAEAVANVSPERLARYFVKRGDHYQVVPDLRQMVVFAPHNVIRDAPFTRIDLITCRNMLIYLQPPAQRKVLTFFHFALKRGGVVMLGPSESPGTLLNDFETIDKRWRVYRKYTDVRMPVGAHLQPQTRALARTSAVDLTAPGTRSPLAQLLNVYDALLEERMPASLLINDRGELVHAFGGAGGFLKVRDGRLALQVVDMVDADLRMILTNGLSRALRDTQTSVYNGVRADDGTGSAVYRVSIRRVAEARGLPHVLITFDKQESAQDTHEPVEVEIDLGQVSRDRLDEVEAELNHTKESLQAATEELETSNEELQAANEELLASNEELQSTNEELQSVNEELYSVNAEYQRKIADLTELTNDMENLLSSTEIGTIFLDRELRIRKFTARIASSFNLLPHDVGRSIETFTHNIDHPELIEDLRRVIAGGESVEHEFQDRRGRSFFLRLLPYRAKGEIHGVVLMLIDVTGLKAAEDALFRERYLLNSLVDGVPEAIYFKDARGRIIRANRAMATRLGVSEAADAVGKTALELSGQDALRDHEQDDIVLSTGRAQNYRLEQRKLKSGQEAWDLASRIPLTDRDGHIVGLIGIFRDVSEQKRSEEKIQESIRRRDQFLAMLSHELRNPLGAVITAMTLVRDGAEQSEKLLSIIDRQAKHMGRLLDDLLEASRVTQNKIELRMQPVELSTIIKDAVDAVRNVMSERGLTLTTDVAPGPLLVTGDEARLLQIHVNLLSNAAKYTPRGGHVTLLAKREDGVAVVRIRDDGVGIPKELLGQIFELFVQARRTIDRSDGGLGLGLTLVKSLVEMHGGGVSARSDGEGHGSEFEVRLPLALAHHDERPKPAQRVGAQLAKGARIVVVEDNSDGREALCELLSLAGYDCHSAGEGDSGLSLIERLKPHAAIVDLGLPVLDGLQIARRLRADARYRDLYLIALTGYGQRADRDNALAAGFNEHLVKPVDTRELLRLLGDKVATGIEPT